MSNLYQSLSHSKWNCKYHIIFIPKKRKSVIYGKIRKELAKILHELATQKESKITEGNLSIDHVHMCIEIPPKYAVTSVIGFMKGKSAIAIARMQGKDRNYTGAHFWARGYAVSTIGFAQKFLWAFSGHASCAIGFPHQELVINLSGLFIGSVP